MSFKKGFEKIAATLVTMSPEEYYSTVGEKDPFVGALIGAGAGGITGALKKKSHKAALIGAALGSGAGASAGYVGGKGLRHYQAHKVRKLTGELNLKSTPGHKEH